MKSIVQHIELASHIAIIIVAILLSIVLVKTYLIPKSTETNYPIADAGRNIAPSAVPDLLGRKINLPDVNWEKNGQTLVLALQTGCHFCTESAPFYKALAQNRSKHENTRLIAVLPQPVDASRNYLSNLGIVVDDVKQLQLPAIGVQGTPTLLLIDKNGVVINAWRGKLPPSEEAKVLSHI